MLCIDSTVAIYNMNRTYHLCWQWRRQIRQDLGAMVPPEPPGGLEDVTVRVRFSDGTRISRHFRHTDSVQVQSTNVEEWML